MLGELLNKKQFKAKWHQNKVRILHKRMEGGRIGWYVIEGETFKNVADGNKRIEELKGA